MSPAHSRIPQVPLAIFPLTVTLLAINLRSSFQDTYEHFHASLTPGSTFPLARHCNLLTYHASCLMPVSDSPSPGKWAPRERGILISFPHSLTVPNASQTVPGTYYVLNKYFKTHIKKPQIRNGKNVKTRQTNTARIDSKNRKKD